MTNLLVKIFIKNNKNVTDGSVRQKYGFLSGFVGIIANVLLFSGKIISGVITGSIAIVADAVNNLSDAGSSVITLIGFKMAGAPPDKEHPFGHGRIEYLAGLIVSFIIILMSFELGKSSIEKIISPEESVFDVLSVVILAASILVKIWLCFFNRKLGNLINSTAMRATAMDSLTDVVATCVALAGLIISTLTSVNIDGWAGLLVALFIAYTGIKTAQESISALVGQKPDKELVQDIYNTVLSYKGIVGVHDLIVHNYGVSVIIVSLHAEVSQDMDFVTAHELIDVIEDDLKIKYKCLATIHMDPVAVDDEESNAMKSRVVKIVSAIDPEMSIHDFRMTKGVNHKNLIFDVVVPFKFRLSDEEVINSIQLAISAVDDSLSAVINVDKQMS